MLIFRLWNYINGYAEININSANYEKTLNSLKKKKIKIWDIEKQEKGITFKISYNDYIKHQTFLREINAVLIKKLGFALSLGKLKMRKGFFIGVMLLVICLFIFASMVWDVEVLGTKKINVNEVMKVLEDNSISTPFLSRSIDKKHIESVLYQNFDNLKFVEVHIQGSKLLIFLKEKSPENIEIENKIPSNIVAVKDALINKVIAKNGKAVVQPGMIVYKGQTLIMGIIKDRSEEIRMVPSIGTVYGKTYYNFQMKENKSKNLTIATNKKEDTYYLKINDKKVKIIGDSSPFENYNYSESTIKLFLISDITNIYLVKGKYYEEKTETININKETAENKMKVAMYDDLLKKCSIDSKIANTSLNFTEDDQFYYLDAQIEVIEDIGESVRIFPDKEE